MRIITIGLLCMMVNNAYGSNILVMMPVPAISHTNGFKPIFIELARRGHNVTMVSPFPLKEPIPNYKDIVLENTFDEIQSRMNVGNFLTGNNFLFSLLGLIPLCKTILDPVFNIPEFKEFLKEDKSKFDLVILEVFFCQQPLLALGHKYGVPVVSMVSPGLGPSTSEVSGNSNPTAYVPNMLFPVSDHMTFWERVQNTFFSISDIVVTELYGSRMLDSYMREHIGQYPGYENLPTVSEMLRNISLFMLDTHFSLNYPRPYLPNVVEFGGLSIQSGGKLPADLDKFINESKDGVIYFSWGSHYKMTNMKPELLSAFMSIFGKLKQRVLMKWENETLPGKPDNVKTDVWFPQSSILSHPNIRLFISHGGIHGTTEAVYNAVPVLGTPVFGDQHFNLHMLKEAGMGLYIDMITVTEEQLYTVIKKLLDDPKFKENAKKKSMIMKDRPINTLDNAVYWIEYVLRHNGAYHLRPGSLDLAWYQNLLLDIAAAFLAVTTTIVMFSIYIVKLLCKLFKSKGKGNKNEEKKKRKNKKD